MIEEAVEEARRTVGQNSRNAGDIVVVGRRHPRLADLLDIERQEIQKTIGVLGERILAESLRTTSVLVIQAATAAQATATTSAVGGSEAVDES